MPTHFTAVELSQSKSDQKAAIAAYNAAAQAAYDAAAKPTNDAQKPESDSKVFDKAPKPESDSKVFDKGKAQDLVLKFFQSKGAASDAGCTVLEAAQALASNGVQEAQVRSIVGSFEVIVAS